VTRNDPERQTDRPADPDVVRAAFQEARDTISAIEEIAQLGRWDWDLATQRWTGSSRIYTIFGLDPEKDTLSLENFLESVHPDDRELASTTIQNALEKLHPISEKYRIILPDGTVKWVLSRALVQVDDEGHPVRLSGTTQDIDEYQRAIEELRVTEARYKNLFDQAGVGVTEVEMDGGRFVRVNQRACEILGRSEEELARLTIGDVTHPEDLQSSRERFVALKTGATRSSSTEKRYIRGDGSVVWVDVTVTPLWEPGEAPTNCVGVVVDVTNRKRAEEAERAHSRQLDLVLRSSMDSWVLFDVSGRILDVNDAYTEMIGFTRGEMVGSTFDQLGVTAAPDRFPWRVEEILKHGHVRFETQQRKRDGSIVDLEVSAAAQPGIDGPAIAAFGRDITERKRTQLALEQSERTLRELVEHINGIFWVHDLEKDQTVYVSPAFETIWGKPPDGVYEDFMEWGRGVHPEDRDACIEKFFRLREAGGGDLSEYRIIRPNGEIRWLWDRAFTIQDEAGKVVRIAGIAEDITERKREEEEKQLLQAKIQHAQKLESLGVLAGGIAHDFNNLLMAILGNADLALDTMSPEAPGREYVDKIEKAAQNAAGLTNQMLAYSGRGRFLIQTLQLNRLVSEMAHLLETVISKKANLQFDFAENLPHVEADASQIRQIVMNLITNGSEALADKAGTLKIATGTVEADRSYLSRCYLGEELPEGTYVALEVSDTGCGMDKDTQRRIFDPFFTTKFTGRGLGLAAALGIVRGHNGTINVYSEPGMGTTIKVLFPMAAPKAEPKPVQRESNDKRPVGNTVLVVEDDKSVLDVTTRMLEKAGHKVLKAMNGQEGVDLFTNHQDQIALVILDMTMPVMDGEEAFRHMSEIRPGVPVILCSGYNEQDATNRFAGQGLAGFIQKPYRSSDLLAQVAEVLEDE